MAAAPAVPRPGESLPGGAPTLAAAPPAPPAPGASRSGPRPAPGVVRRSLRACVAESAAAEVFGACAGGAVLTAWALHLGATAFVIGVLAALPFASQVLQLPAAWLTQRFGVRRVSVAAVGASRLAWLPMVAIPLVDPGRDVALRIFIAVIAVAAVLGVVGNNAWTAWVGALVPAPIRGRFFSRRTMSLTAAGTVASLVAGVTLDTFTRGGFREEGLALLAGVACIAGLASIGLLLRQHDPAPSREPADRGGLRRAAQDPRARSLIRYLVVWNAAVALSAGFFAFHMLGHLGMGLTMAAGHGVVVAVVRIVSAPLWGRAVDRVGARPVLVFCSLGIGAVPGLWLFATPTFLWPIALEAVIAGALWGGHGIASMDLTMHLSAGRARPFYLAIFAAAGGIAFAAASVGAGLLASQLPVRFDVLGASWTGTHVLFLLSAVARTLAAVPALGIEEAGARPVRDLVRLLVTETVQAVHRRWPSEAGWRSTAPRSR